MLIFVLVIVEELFHLFLEEVHVEDGVMIWIDHVRGSKEVETGMMRDLINENLSRRCEKCRR